LTLNQVFQDPRQLQGPLEEHWVEEVGALEPHVGEEGEVALLTPLVEEEEGEEAAFFSLL